MILLFFVFSIFFLSFCVFRVCFALILRFYFGARRDTAACERIKVKEKRMKRVKINKVAYESIRFQMLRCPP